MSNKLKGYEFYHKVLKGAKYIVAPMVDQSEQAWRILSRRYNTELAYTPMLHARMFSDPKNEDYRKANFTTDSSDRPLIVQFCANDPEVLLKAARLVEDQCDAVDINLGCPQGIAKRGKYGAFLMEDWDLIYKLVNTLHLNLKIPVTCKIRIYPEIEKTVRYAKMLESAGCQLLTVHGRLREQRGHKTGLADWRYIKTVKESVSIPVFANGNILYFEDIQRCLEATGCDGIMSAEGNLYNPAIFSGKYVTVYEMAQEYLDICKSIETPLSFIRAHLFKIFRPCLNDHVDLREGLAKAKSLDDFIEISLQFRSRLEVCSKSESFDPENVLVDEDGIKILPSWICQPYIRPPLPMNENHQPSSVKKELHTNDDPTDVELSKKRLGELHEPKPLPQKKVRKNLKVLCSCKNVGSEKCVFNECKKCCMAKITASRREIAELGLDWMKIMHTDTGSISKVLFCEAHCKYRGKQIKLNENVNIDIL